MSYLPLLVLLPLIGAALLGLAPAAQARAIALATAILTCFVSVAALLPDTNASTSSFYQLSESVWLPNIGVSFKFGVDGVSGWLIVLTAALGVGALLCPIPASVGERQKTYLGALLALTGLLCGAFAALDLVMFYLFFEASLVPVYFLVGLFGGAHRARVATKFIVYSVFGALCLLAAIIGLRAVGGTFDIAVLRERHVGGVAGSWIFVGLALAFAVKTPLFPLHTWQSGTYKELPTPALLLVAGSMAKLGTYGFFRFCIGILPEASWQFGPAMVWLAAIGIVYAALVAVVQKDLKRVMAFSSVSHLGFIVLGMFSGTPQGVLGACVQMVNHGIIVGGIFLLLAILERRCGTLQIARLGGLWEQMPILSRLFLVFTLASVALPLTNGFVGEFLTLLGAFKYFPIPTALATTGVIWSAVYMLGMYQRTFYGPVRPEFSELPDLTESEIFRVAPLAALVFLLGIYPSPLMVPMDGAVLANLPPLAPTPAERAAAEGMPR